MQPTNAETTKSAPMNPFTEDIDQALTARYGSSIEGVDARLAPLLRHRCIRRYANRDLDPGTVRGLIAAAQSAGTSSHLQIWSLIQVEDPVKRKALAEVATYRHVEEAPTFFVFLADLYRLARNTEGSDALDFTEFMIMATVDAALACERMVCAAESLGLGTCYIGAVRNNPARVAEILDLPQQTFAVVGLTVGWPAEAPTIKPRLLQSEVAFVDQYRRDVEVGEFDERMRGTYASHGQDPNITWSMRSARRAGSGSMTGREVLLGWLRERGFLRR